MKSLPIGFVRISEIPTHGINKEGQIFSTISKKILKTRKDKDGYNRLNLIINGKHKTVKPYHYVARYFVDGYHDGFVPNHKDGNKSNDNSENIEWVTKGLNTNHAIYVLGSTENTKVKPMGISLIKDGVTFTYPSIRLACINLGLCRSKLRRNMRKGLPCDGYTATLVN